MKTDFAVGSNCCGIRLKLRSIFPLLLSLLLLGVDAAEAQTHAVLKSFGSISDGTGGRSRTPLVRGADGTLYGATSGEFGAAPSGALFKLNADGSGYSALKWFINSLPAGAAPDGLSPGTLALAGNIIYGTTSGGGLFGSGTVFKINVDGTGYTVLKQLSETLTGNGPSSLMLSGNTLFITTTAGGAQVGTGGTIFKVNTDGTGFSVIKSFVGSTITTPSGPSGKLLLLGNTLFGTTSFGGSAYYGTIFKLNTDGSGFSVIRNLGGATGQTPRTGLIEIGGELFGATSAAGSLGGGTIFKLGTNGTGFTVLRNLPNGSGIWGDLALSGNILYGASRGRLDDVSAITFKMNTDGSSFAALHTNTAPEGVSLDSGVMLDGDTLYGMAAFGGVSDLGTIFKMKNDGSGFTVLKQFTSFASITGKTPLASGPILSGGVLYGTTTSGGAANAGTLYRVNTDGSDFSVIKQFTVGISNADAAQPNGGLVQIGNTFFGMSSAGGSENRGAIFRVNHDGSGYVVIKSITELDGGTPGDAGLVIGNGVLYGTLGGLEGKVFELNLDGSGFQLLANISNPRGTLLLSGDTLYGTTAGGDADVGTVFKVNIDGSGYSVLKEFLYTDGAFPVAGLALSGDTLYGTTSYGGDADKGTVFKVNTNGSGFAVLRHFLGAPEDGENPFAALLVSDSIIYGSTSLGGASNAGMIFQMNTDGSSFTVLKHYSGSDGHGPTGNLLLDRGVLYGTTAGGGALGFGTIYSIALQGPPSFAIRRLGENVILTWPSNSSVFTLQSTTNLAIPNTWNTIFPMPTVDDGRYTVTVTASGGQTFYRLREIR